jgi:hypothetical protein
MKEFDPSEYYYDPQREYVDFMLETISDIYACEPTIESINKAAYKDSDCGIGVYFDDGHLYVTAIVEGAPGEFEQEVDLSSSEDTLRFNFIAAVNAAEVWAEEYLADDYDDSMDGDFDSAMASAGYGMDEDYGG